MAVLIGSLLWCATWISVDGYEITGSVSSIDSGSSTFFISGTQYIAPSTCSNFPIVVYYTLMVQDFWESTYLT